MTSQGRTWLGWAMLAALALHAVSMGRANLPELLWSCHVASACLALGILFGGRTAVATGFLFHLAIGLPVWLVEIVITRGTFGGAALVWHLVATSTLVHLLPIAAGAAWLGFPRHPLPRRAVAFAWLIQVGMILPSRWLTPPELNVNLAHGVWPPVSGTFSRLWLFQMMFSLVCLAALLLVASVLQWRFQTFSRSDAATAPAQPSRSRADSSNPDHHSELNASRPGVRSSRYEIAGLIGVLSLSLWLRVHDLTAQSIWYDEGFSIAVARLGWRDLSRLLAQREANMTLYYLLLKAWLWLGNSEALVRGLSVLIGVGTVAMVYWLGRRLFSPAVGLVSALLLGVNAYHVHFSQEVRSYALVVLLVCLSWRALLLAVEDEGDAHWRWYVLWTALAAYAHFYALLVPVAQWAWLVATKRRQVFRRAFRASRMIGYAILPIVMFVLLAQGQPLVWVPPLSFAALRNLAIEFCGGGAIAVPLVAIACGAGLMAARRSGDRSRGQFAAVLCWLIVPFAIVVLVSLHRPMLWPRFMIFGLPALALLAGVGLLRLPRPVGLTLLVAITMVSMFAESWSANVYYHDDWRSASRFVLAHAGPEDGVLFYQMPGRATFEYYRWLDHHDVNSPIVVCPAHREPYRDLLVEPLAEILPTANMEHRRLWVVFNLYLAPSGPDFGSRVVRAWLRGNYVQRGATHFENIDVALFEHR